MDHELNCRPVKLSNRILEIVFGTLRIDTAMDHKPWTITMNNELLTMNNETKNQ